MQRQSKPTLSCPIYMFYGTINKSLAGSIEPKKSPSHWRGSAHE